MLKIKCFITSVASICFAEFYKILLFIFDMEIMFIYIIFLLLLNNSAIIMPVAAIFWL